MCHRTYVRILAKYCSILIIISLTDSVDNLRRIYYYSSDHTLSVSLHYLVKHECCKLACFVCAQLESCWDMNHQRPCVWQVATVVKESKLDFICLNSRIYECPTSIVYIILMHHMKPLATDWTSCLRENSISAQRFIPRCTRCHSPNFSLQLMWTAFCH